MKNVTTILDRTRQAMVIGEFPTSPGTEPVTTERTSCGGCVSAMCCHSEDPIRVSTLDASRLSAHFDMPMSEFLETFTQDTFEGDDAGEFTEEIENPETSTITHLRRRDNSRFSACIFVKYVKDEQNDIVRRVCSVYDARPFPCRDFYWESCKTRDTGDLTLAVAQAFRNIRSGDLTESMVDERLSAFPPEGNVTEGDELASRAFEHFVLLESKRAFQMEAANFEGTPSPEDYQLPLAEKMNRAFSTFPQRFEEQGPAPEHHDSYSSFGTIDPDEKARLLHIATTRPEEGRVPLYGYGDYSLGAGWIHFVQPLTLSTPFPDLDGALMRKSSQDFYPNEDTAYQALRGISYMVRFTNRVLSLDSAGLQPFSHVDLTDELFLFFSNIQSSESLLRNFPVTRDILDYLAGKMLDTYSAEVDSETSSTQLFYVLHNVTFLYLTRKHLSESIAARATTLIARVCEKLKPLSCPKYVSEPTPLYACFAGDEDFTEGGPLDYYKKGIWEHLDQDSDSNAWDVWYDKVVSPLYLCLAQDILGEPLWGIDPQRLMSDNLKDIEALMATDLSPDRAESFLVIVTHQAYAMSAYSRNAIDPKSEDGERLLFVTDRLVTLLLDNGCEDVELLSEVLDAVYAPLGVVPCAPGVKNRLVVVLTDLVRSTQEEDGSWGSDPTIDEVQGIGGNQGDFLYSVYHTTWTCVDALRVLV